MTVSIETPAKINLTLAVTGKRADGYHLLRSVMQSVSLYDTVTVTLTDTDQTEVTCSLSALNGENNIAARAVRAFGEAVGAPLGGVHIEIVKRIPLQAGLGGGSADAAAVLNALNILMGTELTQEALEQIGARIGADVPFCVRGGTALAEGIGERLTSLPSLPSCAVLLARRGGGVSTPEAYRLLDEAATEAPGDTDALCAALSSGDLLGVANAVGNAFEPALRLPEADALCRKMKRHGALTACLSGSGSAVFGLFEANVPNIPQEADTWTACCSPCSGMIVSY